MTVLGRSLQDRNIKYYNGIAAFSAAILLNAILMYAILRKTPNWLRPFVKIFLLDTFANVSFITVYLLCNVVLITVNENNHTYFIHIMAGLLEDLPQPWTSIFVAFNSFFLNWTVSVVPVKFLYRYLSVCHDYEIGIPGFIFITLLSTIAPGIYAITTLIYEHQGEPLKKGLTNLFNGTDWLDSDGLPPSFGLMLGDTNTLHTYIIPISVFIDYIIVSFCAIKIWRKVQKLRKLQDKYMRKSYSLNIILISNAVVPLIVQVVPSGGISLSKIFSFNMHSFLVYISMISPWTAAISPFMELLVVSPYRKFLMCKKKRNFSTTRVNDSPMELPNVPKKHVTKLLGY